ncbi:hypothetical protein BST28_17460 [Mycolicibacter kumamotonensis]|uniref:Uncharacterized protein n=1 Tax=Mycolicibacter kumamotonensis TaxID=354243 RepID=A0A1X0E0M8_9MYCO|nr:hypothetical protein [Mycolicibacter kumamotonensis]ORA77590.1 hypothetical protein BST28_17460 [Mycolicibacter kumamotonensis]
MSRAAMNEYMRGIHDDLDRRYHETMTESFDAVIDGLNLATAAGRREMVSRLKRLWGGGASLVYPPPRMVVAQPLRHRVTFEDGVVEVRTVWNVLAPDDSTTRWTFTYAAGVSAA